MSDEKDREDPSTTSNEYDFMLPWWDKMSALLGGTRAMRDAGTAYLPQHTAETDEAYEERLRSNILFNMTELTLRSWVGRPFSDPVKMNKEVPEEILKYEEDINTQGDSIAVFLRNWFDQGLQKALCHVLVEFPKKREREDGKERTLADDREDGLRPYWVLVKPEQLLFAHAETVEGKERLMHVRIFEAVTEMDGFAQVVREQIRVLEPGHGELWRKKEKKNEAEKDEWIKFDEWETPDMEEIPLVTFYADRIEFMIGKPPLADLADLNVRWWQSNSDQINTLTVARFPMLAQSGGNVDDAKLKIGPRKWLYTPDANGKFYYVEHKGEAITAGRQELLDLEAQMANYGAEFLRKRKTNETATARALDSAESTSPLQDVTLRFADAVQQALRLTAKWLDLDDGGKVLIATDFGPENVSREDFDALKEARRLGDISREVFLEELRRRGVLSDEFDAKKNDQQLEDAVADFTAAPITVIDPDAEE